MQTDFATFALHALDRDQTEAVLRDLWRGRLVNADFAIAKHFTEDAVYKIFGGLPAGTGPKQYNGRDAIMAAIRHIGKHLEFQSFVIQDMLVDGKHVALRWLGTIANRKTGVVGELSVFDHIIIENGKISSYTEFLDTDALGRLMAGEAQTPRSLLSNRNSPISDVTVRPAISLKRNFHMRNRREKFLREYWARRLKDGSAAVDFGYADDGEVHLIGDTLSIPFARSHRGKDEVKALVAQTNMEFEILSFAIRNVLVDGDRAAVHWHANVRHRGTSARGEVEAFCHICFKGERIGCVVEFLDTAQTARWIAG